MGRSLYDRLLDRELGHTGISSKPKGIYGDKAWVHDLDIVNELDGHTGCVNALSWAKSGRLLASGSDDEHINIHQYLPDSSTSQFSLNASITTGHTQNIFSIKFMPQSGDRTIVSAAGDGEVRIFDVEYAGRSQVHLSEADTSAKVFKSHADRVKKIVTESSPFYFLTCSEDGEVRQWDTRQPSSAYPAPRMGFRNSAAEDNVPPPLISYRKHNIELNTISCSPTQPHYIALGGSHLHCFIHDRRMLGRDKLSERGSRPISSDGQSDREEELMAEATQCVRKFAPNGKRKMTKRDSGHITACKISDYNPNELIVSWSQDHIYSFDIVSSPDASQQESNFKKFSSSTRRHKGKSKEKDTAQLKRKRPHNGSQSSQELKAGGTSKRLSTEAVDSSSNEMALKIQYQNGQSEEFPIDRHTSNAPPSGQESELSEDEQQALEIAKSIVKMKRKMFMLKNATKLPDWHLFNRVTSILGLAASILPDIDEKIRTWGYPVNPSRIDVVIQTDLRHHREAARGFVQTAGTWARVLGARLQTGGSDSSAMMDRFAEVAINPNLTQSQAPTFHYQFLKAISLWLDSGIGSLLEGFTMPRNLDPNNPKHSSRYPIPPDAGADAIQESLIPYLWNQAGDNPVPDLEPSRFEVDENMLIYHSEKLAVLAFAKALQKPFHDLASLPPENEEEAKTQSRYEARKFWALRVGRSLLWRIANSIDFDHVNDAFGGRPHGKEQAKLRKLDAEVYKAIKPIDPDEEEEPVEGAQLVHRFRSAQEETPPGTQNDTSEADASSTDESEDAEGEEDFEIPLSAVAEMAGDTDSEYDIDSDESDEADDDEDEDEDDTMAPLISFPATRAHFRRNYTNANVPYSSHTRAYKGHCNVKTVKDVNFYGPHDEYVVSGSDCGNLFIWDRKTTQLLNILEGDGEVVNVVQGHPYEPVMAVSGIDNTVKIFSPDARDRDKARRGIGVKASDPSAFSSISFTRMRRSRQRARSTQTATTSEAALSPNSDDEDDEVVGPEGLESRRRMDREYEITSRNDSDRQSSGHENYITSGMLLQLARHVSARQLAEGGGGRSINLEECHVQ